MVDWAEQLRQMLIAEGHAVVITVAVTRGSTPREAGAKMIVTRGASWGTVGGGHLEYEAQRLARDSAAAHDAARETGLVRFPLAARLGQCCGGVASLALQHFDESDLEWIDALCRSLATRAAAALVSCLSGPRRAPMLFDASLAYRGPENETARKLARRVLSDPSASPLIANETASVWLAEIVAPLDFEISLFGNGHVGRALATILQTLPCKVRWIDERAADFPPSVAPNIEIVVTDSPVDEVAIAKSGSLFVVTTHSHPLDLVLVAAILKRGDFDYLGLIGSRSKRAQFERRLAARGMPEVSMRRITCPIGGPARDKHPGAIALATALELLQVRQSRSGVILSTRLQA